ncbi:MAG: class I SAM-dependent methyltransferase [Mesorhizobium sp.]|nr:MAG: class I SAM-dependent methyltransferase [Mesorhizobium sp.]
MKKQVDATHYNFGRYMSKKRWASVWHQLDEILRLSPASVLEIGPGLGITKDVLSRLSVTVETVDIDHDLNPDYVATATSLPLADASFDVVCAFQVLEHLEYTSSRLAFKELSRVAKRFIVISLPDAKTSWSVSFQMPVFGEFSFRYKKPNFLIEKNEFDGEHYWELNRRGTERDRVIGDFSKDGSAKIKKSFSVKENPYHCFMIFEKL